MRRSNRWTFYFLILWSIPWCYAAAGTCSRTLLSFANMAPEVYQYSVGLIVLSTPFIILTNFKFNPFGRYFTIVLLALYSAISISHVVNLIKIGYTAQENKIAFAFLIIIVNFYAIYYFLGKPYGDRLKEFNVPSQQPDTPEHHRKSSQKAPAARRRRSKKH